MITQEQFQMMLNNRQYLNQQLAQFQQQAAQQLQQNSPQNIIQQKLSSGAMSQEDFQRCRMLANQIMGVNY